MDRVIARSDADLLRHWADHRSAEAFAALVHRYAGLVQAIATRSLYGDRTTAEDVTQAVFILLSEKAGRLDARPSLAAWLHRVTCYAAANARRIAGRRTKYERVAAAERPEASMTPQSNDGLSEQLDAAINSLGVADRRLILERYLVGQDEAVLAESLGLSRATLQRRLSRAIHRLRSQLGRSAPTAALLPVMLTQQSAPSVSTALIEQIRQTAAGVPRADAVGTIVRLTRRNLAMEMLAKVGTAAAIPVAGLGLILAALLASQSPADPPATAKATTAPTTAPAEDQVRAPTDVDVADTAQRIAGRWRVTGAWVRGRAVPKEQLGETTMLIENDRIDTFAPGRKGDSATFTLTAGERWVHVDLQDDDRPDRVVPGIVKIENDVVWLAFDDRNRVRPLDFPPAASVNKGWRLERVKP